MNFKYIGKLDVSLISDEVKNLTDWNEYKFRQKTYVPHKKTKTIPLIYDEDFRHIHPTYWKNYHKYKKYIDMFTNFFNKNLGKGYIIRAILVKLLAKSKIPKHIDTGYSLSHATRIHIPVITNDQVSFTVGEETKILRKGEIWQINNSNKIHSVKNDSKEDRIHLIIDWVKN